VLVTPSAPGGKDNNDYHKQEVAVENYIKTYSLFVSSSIQEPDASMSTPQVQQIVKVASTPGLDTEDNLAKFVKLVETCYRRGKPSETEVQLLERFRQKYFISPEAADRAIARYSPAQDQQEAISEFNLMYRAFLENDNEIDFEEQSQLLELQEELNLSNEQVFAIEASVKAELGISQ